VLFERFYISGLLVDHDHSSHCGSPWLPVS
jgi:hypothetical protein